MNPFRWGVPASFLCFLAFSGCAKDDVSDDGVEDTSTPVVVDEDQDGVPAEEDCDDTNGDLGAITEDADCDGTLTAEDCDDTDAESTVVAEDADCDGTLTDEDCDDTNADLGAIADDADCDGALTDDDCDDGDAESTVVADDADCDGALTDDDCDDGDASIHPGATDGLLADRDCVEGIADNSLALTDYIFLGEHKRDKAGHAISSAGDVDGDGLDDILVGAYLNNESGSWAGKVYLILGSSLVNRSEISLSFADYSFIGEEEGDRAGVSVSGAGDVDGDGLDDILVGASADNVWNGTGQAYLVLGSSLDPSRPEISLSLADYVFVGNIAGGEAGESVAGAGDVDGDGLDDILVGAADASRAYIILGSSLGVIQEINLSDADYHIHGSTGDGTGSAVASAGDVDGDGLADILVGARYRYWDGIDAGGAYLIFGKTLIASPSISLYGADYSFVGDGLYNYIGWAVSGAGDVDGDGFDDILVGRSGNTAYLVLAASLGSTSEVPLSLADYRFVGEGSGDYAGRSISSAGDVDGDGLDDILVGAHYNNAGGKKYAGQAYLILGDSLGSTSEISLSSADYSFVGEFEYDRVGKSVSSAGDVNGDGLADILVGSPYNNVPVDQDLGGDEAGTVYLILSGL